MLGKLIKYEIRNRYQRLGIMTFIILASAIVERAVLGISMYTEIGASNTFNVVFGLLTVLCVGAQIFSAAIILLSPISEFSTRLLGDQGYLTHTLPVKSSEIVFSRMIMDFIQNVYTVILAAASFAIVFLTDKNMTFALRYILKEAKRMFRALDASDGEIAIYLILIFAAVILQYIFTIWLCKTGINITRNLVRTGSKAIMALVVAGLFVLWSIFISVFTRVGATDFYADIVDSVTNSRIGSQMFIFVSLSVIYIILLIILGLINSGIFKRKLNLA